MFEVDVELDAAEFIAAWRPDVGRLLLPVDRVPRLHEKTVARLRLRGEPGTTVVVGSVVCAYHHGSTHRVLFTPDDGSLSAVRRLHAAATGGPVHLADRAPRFLTAVPTIVETGKGDVLMNIISVSSGGCCLEWTGPAPPVGRSLRLWLGDRVPPADVHGVVCWSAAKARPISAGLALIHEGSTARTIWTRFVSDVELGGARQV